MVAFGDRLEDDSTKPAVAFFFFFFIPVDLAGSDLLDSRSLPAWGFLSPPPTPVAGDTGSHGYTLLLNFHFLIMFIDKYCKTIYIAK